MTCHKHWSSCVHLTDWQKRELQLVQPHLRREVLERYAHPQDFGGSFCQWEAVVASVVRAMEGTTLAATPSFATARNMIEAVAQLDREGSRCEHAVPTPQEAVTALPLQAVCTRCGGHHRQSQCRSPCIQCRFVWPEHSLVCDMRYDTSETRLVAVHDVPSGRGDITTDLEGGESFNLTREQVVAASTSEGDALDRMEDHEVVAMYLDVLRERYAPIMPPCCDAEATSWVRWLDDAQLAVLCRAVGRIEDTMASYAARTDRGTTGTEVLWTPETRAALTTAYAAMRRVVSRLVADLAAVLESMVTSE